jgi:Domain of unknown function (DUF4169)
MSADILSLSKARKAKARADKEAKAAGNRVLHGRTKAEKQLANAEKALADKRVAAHRLEPAPVATLTLRKPDA